MSADEEFRVPRREARVELALRGSLPRQGVVFLSPELPESPERDDVSHFLEEAPPFFPFREEGKTVTMLVARDACVWLRAPVSAGATELYEHAVELAVELDTADGTAVSGSLFYSAPHDHERLLDVLNGQTRFLRLVVERGVCFVHKAHVTRVSAS